MTANLPPQLLKLFTPRPFIPYLPPTDKDFSERTRVTFEPLSAYIARAKGHDLDYKPVESAAAKKARKLQDQKTKAAQLIQDRKSKWDPTNDPNAIGTDPYKTIFVGRLPYSMTEKQLEREFARYGDISRIFLVRDTTDKAKKSRGYAFIEFERESDVRLAQREMDGFKMEGRRIVVDVERGRTVKDWLPRKLGGGLGKTRAVGAKKPSNRPMESSYRSRPGIGQGRFERGGGYPDRPRFGDRGRDRDRPYDRQDRHERGSYDRPRDGYDRGRRDSGRSDGSRYSERHDSGRYSGKPDGARHHDQPRHDSGRFFDQLKQDGGRSNGYVDRPPQDSAEPAYGRSELPGRYPPPSHRYDDRGPPRHRY